MIMTIFQQTDIKKGLIIVSGEFSKSYDYVYTMLLKIFSSGCNDLLVPIPAMESIYSLHHGSERYIENLKNLHRTFIAKEPENPSLEFNYLNTTKNFDWTCEEAIKLIEHNVNKNRYKCIFIGQDPSVATRIDGLLKLKNLAMNESVHLVFIHPRKDSDSLYKDISNEFISINECEPNPKFFKGFSIDFGDTVDFTNPLVAKQLCSSRICNDVMQNEITPYISDSLITRFILALKKTNMSLDEIGKKIGMNKSSVSRKLSKLQERVQIEFTPDFIHDAADALGIDMSR